MIRARAGDILRAKHEISSKPQWLYWWGAKSRPNDVTSSAKVSFRNMGKKKNSWFKSLPELFKLSKTELKYKSEQPLEYLTYGLLEKTPFTFWPQLFFYDYTHLGRANTEYQMQSTSYPSTSFYCETNLINCNIVWCFTLLTLWGAHHSTSK